MIEGMEASDRALFDDSDTLNKSIGSISNLIMTRLAKFDSPLAPEMKLFYSGFYAVYLTEWLAHFRLGDTLHLIDNEMLVQRPLDALRQLETFLGLTPLFQQFPSIFEQGDNGFYCVNNTVRIELVTYYDSELKSNDDKPYRSMLDRYGRSGLDCQGASKSRTRTKEKTPSELAALARLTELYAESNRALTQMINNQDYAAWTRY